MNIYGYVLLVNVISADMVRIQQLLPQQNPVETCRKINSCIFQTCDLLHAIYSYYFYFEILLLRLLFESLSYITITITITLPSINTTITITITFVTISKEITSYTAIIYFA